MKTENLMNNTPVMKDESYVDLINEDSIVMGRPLHSMEPHMGTTIECCDFSNMTW